MQAAVLNASGMIQDRESNGERGRMPMTRVAMTFGSTFEISRDQLGKDALSRGASELRALELCNTSLTRSPSALHANSAHCPPRLPGVRQQELIRGAVMNSPADNAAAREYDAQALPLLTYQVQLGPF
jgi:hypothetical protein